VITVIDSPCGAGKTTWAIKYMNEHEHEKFIYVTPFLSEVERLQNSITQDCVTPKNIRGNKTDNFRELVKYGHHVIVTTHALLKGLSIDMAKLINNIGYTLILDESLEVISISEVTSKDIHMLCSCKYISIREDGKVSVLEDFTDSNLNPLVYNQCINGRVYCKSYIGKENNKEYNVFEVFPPELFTCFDKVYLLTYLVDYQIISKYFVIYNIDYEKVSVVGGELRHFGRTGIASNLIEVYTSKSAEEIGFHKYELTNNWYDRKDNAELIKSLHGSMRYFATSNKAKNKDIMWTCYKKHNDMLSAKGFKNNFVPCNSRATNEFSSRHYIAYMINRYMNPAIKDFLRGFSTDSPELLDMFEDMWAVSELIQFVYRSAIRNGEKIKLYLPSKRMSDSLRLFINNYGNDKNIIYYIQNS
jgi:hypothetical protein